MVFLGWGWLSQTRPIPRSSDGDKKAKVAYSNTLWNCLLVGRRCSYNQKRKDNLILPTRQWYDPSAVINDALIMHYLALPCTICTILNYHALSCTILHYLALSWTILNNLAKSCAILHNLAQSCAILHNFAPPCTILHYLALSCIMLHHVAPCCTILH